MVVDRLTPARWLLIMATCAAWPAVAQTAGSATPPANPTDTPAASATPEATTPQTFALHAQATVVVQANPSFHAAFEGPNSLRSRGETRETADVTLYAGVKPWRGGELWINPEMDQGFGLGDTLGAAGFPSGEAYKVGKANPYFKLQRLFFRQTIDLDGTREAVAADLNQLGGSRATDRLVLTVGKFSVGDIFDSSSYAHDPRGDVLNWTLLDAGSFDYAANAWGYTYGGAAELYRGRFTLRAGLFDLSVEPNSEHLESNFRQYQLIFEVEERHQIGGRDGKVKVTGFASHGNMARLDDATALGLATRQTPDVALVRHFATRTGVSVLAEQAVTDTLGLYARAGVADGRYEAFEFTDIDRTLSVGLALKGIGWGRADDRIGLGFVVNGASAARKRYLAAGGLGILVGDGALVHAGDEHIVETYYDFAVIKAAHVTADFQLIDHPAYNRDSGPAAVLGARFHVQY